MKNYLRLTFLLGCCLLFLLGAQAQTPVAHYSFSGNANDASTFENHAAVQGAFLTQDRFGWANSAMDFDGIQSAVIALNGAHLNSTATSVAFWVNVTELPPSGEVYLISHGGWQERYKVSLPFHGKLTWSTNSTDGVSDMDAGDGNELQTGVWTHVVMVHDGAKDKIYMNGTLAAEKDVTGDLNSTNRNLGIGYDPVGGGNFFNGKLDEVMVFDVALTDMQISDLYNEQNTTPSISPEKVAAYAFSGSGADDSGYNNHVDISTGKLTTDRFGFGNSAIALNESEVGAPNTNQLNSATTSVAFWVKPNSFPASGEVYILSFGGWQERWKISLPSHGKPVWSTKSTSGNADMDSGDGNELQVGVWSHLVMVHDGAKDKIYLDGVKVAERDATGDLNNTTYPLGIGYDPVGGGNYFDGCIDELEIYNFALTDQDIADAYAAQSMFPGTPSNLVAEYKLNGNGADATQFKNHGQLDDDAKPTSNRHGWGSNALAGAVTADNSPAMNSDYATISFWVKPNSFPVSGEVYLLSNGGWQERWKVSLPFHGKPVFTTYSDGVCCSNMDSGTPLDLDTWTHVAMVHDGTKDKIFLDGALANEQDVTGTLDPTKYPFGIGYDPIDMGSYFDGAMDDVQIYNEALTDMEILDLYNAQSPAPTVPGNLVAHYEFGGNGDDATPYNNHASLPRLTRDQFNRANMAAAFDGATEVTAANSPQLNSPKTTVSFWVNLNSLPPSGEVYLLSFGGWQERWKISLPSHGKVVWSTKGTSGNSDMDSGDGNELQVGVWTHVVMVHDGAKDLIYLNGTQVAEKDVTGDLNNTTHPLGMGYDPVGGGSWMDGDLDEVQIYDVALDAGQIATLYNEQSTPPAVVDDERPTAPLNLAADVEFNNVDLNWFPASDNVGVVAYNVYLDNELANTTPHTTAYFSALTPLTEFEFGVSAVDAEGNESIRTQLKVTTGPDQVPDTIPPSVPGNLMGNPSFSSVLLSWEASTDNNKVNGYIIWVDGAVFDTVEADVLSVLVTGLEPEELYTFEVAAFDLAGNLSDLAELTISTTKPIQSDEPGLVAHYPFDGDANDATPFENHGVIGGNPVFEPSTHAHGPGMNIKFDGQKDSVLAPNAVQLLSDYATVSFWVRVDSINLADAEAYLIDFGHWDERWKISLPQHLKIVWTTNSMTIQFPELISDMDSGDGNEMVKGFWWYVTMVHDGDDDIIYVNGIEANRKPAPGTLNTTARSLGFGNNPVDGGQYFIGALDNVKIYDRALTADEAARLYEVGTVDAKEPNLVQAYIESVFPNPASEFLTVSHSLPSSQPLLVRVFDLEGRQLDQLKLDQSEVATGQFQLNVGTYPAGMYSLNFVLGGKNLGSIKFNKI